MNCAPTLALQYISPACSAHHHLPLHELIHRHICVLYSLRELSQNGNIVKGKGVPARFDPSLVHDTIEDDADFIITVAHEFYAAHGTVLNDLSRVFEVMVKNGMQELRSKEIKLQNIKKRSWEVILEPMYTKTEVGGRKEDRHRR